MKRCQRPMMTCIDFMRLLSMSVQLQWCGSSAVALLFLLPALEHSQPSPKTRMIACIRSGEPGVRSCSAVADVQPWLWSSTGLRVCRR